MTRRRPSFSCETEREKENLPQAIFITLYFCLISFMHFKIVIRCERSEYQALESNYLNAKSKIEQLEMTIKLKEEAWAVKEAAWKSKVGFQINNFCSSFLKCSTLIFSIPI